jgi:hypothetical protein
MGKKTTMMMMWSCMVSAEPERIGRKKGRKEERMMKMKLMKNCCYRVKDDMLID